MSLLNKINSIQKDFKAEAIVDFATPLLENLAVRKEMLEGYKRLRADLGETGVTDRAAKEIFDLATQ